MSPSQWILGLGASHNGSACLLRDGELFVAIQEERISGIKRAPIWACLPSLALNYCLEAADITPEDLDAICCCICSLHPLSHPNNDLSTNPRLRTARLGTRARTITHHLGHAISAFGTSGFTDAAVLVVDGWGSFLEDLDLDERAAVSDAIVGPKETISMYEAEGIQIRPLLKYAGGWVENLDTGSSSNAEGMRSFNSLGDMFSSVSDQIFGANLDAGKVMGLAPYGKPTIPIEEFLVIEDGHLRFTSLVTQRFPHNQRYPNQLHEYYNLASSVQRALEYAMMYLVRQLRAISNSDNLAMAGGVALNGITNERIVRESGFKNVYIIPAAEDSGTAIGAALFADWQLNSRNRYIRLTRDSLGRSYTSATIRNAIESTPFLVKQETKNSIEAAVDLLCEGKIIGWFSGGCELGPRALGQRSILCDARGADAKNILNSRVKYREDFRPFAPVVLANHAPEWFDLEDVEVESPFMLRVVPVREDKRSLIPAVVHVDGTGRLQTVTKELNGTYYAVVKRFFERTGVPILLNTSLNTRGEPVVETPEDALWCLLMSGLDACVFDGFVVTKEASYPHPLELVPALIGDAVQIEPRPDVPTDLVVSWQTQWGEAVYALPSPLPDRYEVLVAVLREIDGISNGWTILEKINGKPGRALAPESFIGMLAQLRRMGTIAFCVDRPDHRVALASV